MYNICLLNHPVYYVFEKMTVVQQYIDDHNIVNIWNVSGGLSAGGIAGVVFGVLLLVVALGTVGYFGYSLYTKRRIPDSIIGFSNKNYEA